MRHGRIRSRHQRSLAPRRRRELDDLAERDVMTTLQFESWKKQQQLDSDAFMDTEYVLRCSCGRNLKTTIVDACHLGWAVSTRHGQITEAKCPQCSGPALRELERDVANHRRRN